MLPRPVVTGLVVLVAIVWAANVIVGFLYPDRNDPAINAIFAVVMSGVYGLGRTSGALRRRAADALARIAGQDTGQPPSKGDDQQ